MTELIQELEKRFPGHKIEIGADNDMENFTMRYSVSVDGRKLSGKINCEAIQELKAYHGIDISNDIIRVLAEEIEQNLAKS